MWSRTMIVSAVVGIQGDKLSFDTSDPNIEPWFLIYSYWDNDYNYAGSGILTRGDDEYYEVDICHRISSTLCSIKRLMAEEQFKIQEAIKQFVGEL